jgi:DRG Family Regulatory Proteins, Tma46
VLSTPLFFPFVASALRSKTFGLKNKKNSKKVQTYVKQVEQQATHKVEGRRSGGAGGAGPSQNSVAAKKAALAAKLEELQLLNQPLAERPKKTNADEEARRKAREEAEAERARFAALPVEDQIEEERAKLTTRTPVTLALFTAWKEKKNEERLARETALLAAAQKNMSKAERARGGGLTGKSLFEQHQDIFVDDAEADAGKYKPDEKAWIGDGDHRGDGDGEGGDAAEGVGAAPADKQNRPEEQHEPPAKAESDGEGEGEAADAGVGDESLFS